MITFHSLPQLPQTRPWARLLATLSLGMAVLTAHADPLHYLPVVENLEPKTLEYDVD